MRSDAKKMRVLFDITPEKAVIWLTIFVFFRCFWKKYVVDYT